MGKVVSVIVGFFAVPIVVATAVAGWPDFAASVPQPTNEVMLVRPGDPAFSHVPLEVPVYDIGLVPALDGALYAAGNKGVSRSGFLGDTFQRFDSASRSWTLDPSANLDWTPAAPPGMPIDGHAIWVGPNRFFALARPTDGTPQKLRTALAVDGQWTAGPTFPVNTLATSATVLADATIAVDGQGEGLFIAAPSDKEFRAVKLGASLPDGPIYRFGKGVIHFEINQSDPSRSIAIKTRIIDVGSGQTTLGPAETYSGKEGISFSTGATADAALVTVRRTPNMYDRRKLPHDLGYGAGVIAELAFVGGYLELVRRKQGFRGWAWVALGAAIVTTIVGGAALLLAWAFSRVHW